MANADFRDYKTYIIVCVHLTHCLF